MPAPELLILGTAGHIDHGKSTLVKALTGTDPDRLAEEKKRGITIELGFAELVTPGGAHFGVVDVPGHERFVRRMVAGATGVDVAMLVVAADDGVMVQTREHLAVLELLGIPRLFAVITKTDLVEPAWLDLVEQDVRALLGSTPYAEAPIVRASATTGVGLDAIGAVLDDLAAQARIGSAARRKDVLRYPLDRVFTIAGAGTVVTGTLWSGTLAPDDEVEIAGTGHRVRVRTVQVHDTPVDRALPGQRVAANLVGIEKSAIRHGAMLVTPDSLTPVTRFDARLVYLGLSWQEAASHAESKVLIDGVRVHVHHGTAETIGTLRLLEGVPLTPGERAFVQVRTDAPLPVRRGDRFIIRSLSPTWTIGGGEVLDVEAPRRTRLESGEQAYLMALAGHDLAACVEALLDRASLPLTSAHAARLLAVPRADVADLLNRSDAVRLTVAGTPAFVRPERIAAFDRTLHTVLEALHTERPDERDFSEASVRDRLDARLSDEVFKAEFIAAAPVDIVHDGGRLALATAAARVHAADAHLAVAAMERLRAQGLQTDTPDELAAALGTDVRSLNRALRPAFDEGLLVRVGGTLYFAAEVVARAQEKVLAALTAAQGAPVAAASLRDVLGVSRKYAIPLLEYFDAQGISRREGDGRVAGRRAAR